MASTIYIYIYPIPIYNYVDTFFKDAWDLQSDGGQTNATLVRPSLTVDENVNVSQKVLVNRFFLPYGRRERERKSKSSRTPTFCG